MGEIYLTVFNYLLDGCRDYFEAHGKRMNDGGHKLQ